MIDHIDVALHALEDAHEQVRTDIAATQAAIDDGLIRLGDLQLNQSGIEAALAALRDPTSTLPDTVPLVRPPNPHVPAPPVVLPAPPTPDRVPVAARTGKQRGPRPATPREVLAERAGVYLAAVQDGRKPIQALMDRYDVDRSTAKNWPAQLRQAGLLPPADQPQVPVEAPVSAIHHRSTSSGTLVA